MDEKHTNVTLITQILVLVTVIRNFETKKEEPVKEKQGEREITVNKIYIF